MTDGGSADPALGAGFAVVGTDTAVGKTVVTAGLVGWLRQRGRDARAVKPAQTGYPPDDDAAFVQAACGTDAAATCLERLDPALAPAVAADRVDADLQYEEIRAGVMTAVADAEVGVVEGIGGLRVPLADGHEVVDLVAALGLPAVIVARPGLGTLNHTALAVEALERRGVPVHGIVLNQYAGESVAERTNPAALTEMTGHTVWTLPSIPVDPPDAIPAAVAERLPDAVLPV